MATSQPGGHQRHWVGGRPVFGLQLSTNDPGTQLYWVNGRPVALLFGSVEETADVPRSWPYRPDGSLRTWVGGRSFHVLPRASQLASGDQTYWINGRSAADLYPVTARPLSVDSVTPSEGPVGGGTSVTIAGADFDGDATVTFGGVPATSVVVVDPETITCVTPAHAVGAVDVEVTNPTLPESAALVAGFEYESATSNFPALFIAP